MTTPAPESPFLKAVKQFRKRLIYCNVSAHRATPNSVFELDTAIREESERQKFTDETPSDSERLKEAGAIIAAQAAEIEGLREKFRNIKTSNVKVVVDKHFMILPEGHYSIPGDILTDFINAHQIIEEFVNGPALHPAGSEE